MLCPKCNRAISLDYGQDKCPHCNELVGTDTVIKKAPEGLHPPSSEPSNPLVTITEDPDRPPTWDDEGPFFTRLWNTFVATMFHPSTFFSQTPTDAGIGKPLLYALIVGSFGMIFAVIWQFIFLALEVPFFSPKQSEMSPMMPALFTPIILVVWAVLSPIFIIIWSFIYSGILHLSLMIIKGDEQGFEATYRTVAYSTSTYVFNLIPFCGGIIGGIWQIVITIIGLKEAHGISTGKAVVAWILPIIFCCGCGIALFAFGMMGMLGGASAPPTHYGY